ncbi:AraC family transcriptional regulator [Anaerobium acetethylicum]|uniref:AraC-type DNA-binding protein n=1 Tax=Anaerobium acetethylicum TaxID=1619234 RepID=A0A1D3TXB1_9FIRM|nr:AraC family transcriptional regulator [Anaerobium acetethylicum]SCP98943.1 AraC-type DNA-binding protein [Anaerobium acetethylicum]
MLKNQKIFPLVKLTENTNEVPYNPYHIPPNTLLETSPVLASGLCVLDNFHNFSNSFPEKENIFILSHEVQKDFPEHKHSFYEFIYVHKGTLVNIVDGKEVLTNSGDMLLMNLDATHFERCINPETLILLICIKKEFFERTLKSFYEDKNPVSEFLRNKSSVQENHIFFSANQNAKAQLIVSDIINEYINSNYQQSFPLESLLLLLLSNLHPANGSKNHTIDDRTFELVQYIQSHCLKNSFGEIASQLGYNPSYLTTYIKKNTGRNCKDIIQETKLNEAISLLANPTISINDIAELCGYESLSHFFRIFRAKYGITPGEYRKHLL